MKTMTKLDKVVRVPDTKAPELVKAGWVYCAKSVWRKLARGAK